jgi:ribosomal-protein-alanine N-acetyltransferase
MTILHTPRLTLRPQRPGDEDDLYAIRSDPQVMRYGGGLPWTERAQAEKKVAELAAAFESGDGFQFALVLGESGRQIGDCCVHGLHRQSRRGEIGYTLARAYWGQGYMQEALDALLEFAFVTLDLNRLEADIHPDNHASRKVLERFGFEQDGYLRERWIVGDEISDSALFGLLKRDWQARRQSI